MIKYHPQQELLSLHIKGELPLSMSLAISAHADLCGICQHKLNLMTASESADVFDNHVEPNISVDLDSQMSCLLAQMMQNTLDELHKKRLVTVESGFGSRVNKYAHRFCNTEFGELKLSDAELAIIGVLFLRGPQTPGELRTRTQRLYEFADVSAVEEDARRTAQELVEKVGA